MWNVLALVLTPSFIWYVRYWQSQYRANRFIGFVTGDIILAYKRKQIAEIESSHTIDQQFVVGADK
jgi:hypothetical protein